MSSSAKIPQRFIMIDDDAISNMLCQELVRRVCGEVEVQLFLDPEKAFKYIKENYQNPEENIPTILFLDLYNPSMSGWEFLEKYKELSDVVHRQLSVFIVSSTEDQRDLQSAVANVFVSGIIVKPLNKGILGQLIADR